MTRAKYRWDESPWMRAGRASALTGFAPYTLTRWAREDCELRAALGARKIGGWWYFRRDCVLAWLRGESPDKVREARVSARATSKR